MSNFVCPDCEGPAVVVFRDSYCKNDCNSNKISKEWWYVFPLGLDQPISCIFDNHQKIKKFIIKKSELENRILDISGHSSYDYDAVGIGRCIPEKGCRTGYVLCYFSLNILETIKRVESLDINKYTFPKFDLLK